LRTRTWSNVLDHLRKQAEPEDVRDLGDAELLERFRARGDEAAFALLVQRHGPMVLGLCRRLLGDPAEAEDAFQATFLVLLRNSNSIRKRDSLAGWLHGVAYRVATRARAHAQRRRALGSIVGPPVLGPDVLDALIGRELGAVLDEEIQRLPSKYRLPLVLCALGGKTHEETARELGWPKSSVSARLCKARQLLRARLLRRGFSVPALLLGDGRRPCRPLLG
jgi:RNA polymerase sigma factor (sigma-70 family)